MYAGFAELQGIPVAKPLPACCTTFGFERELGLKTYGDHPVNVWEALGFSSARRQTEVGSAGFLTTEAGPYNLEMVISPVYTIELAMSHHAKLNEELRKHVDPSCTFDFGEFDGRVGRPSSLDDWVPDQRYQAMFLAYKLITAGREDQATLLQQFLLMPLWRSTHFSFGVVDPEHRVRVADVLTMLSPYLYGHFQRKFKLRRSARVQTAYQWEIGGYGPGYIIHRDWQGYARNISQQRRLIRFDEVTGRYEPDLKTCYDPKLDITECHPWVRIRPDRVEMRIFPPFTDKQMVLVLADLLPLINVIVDSLYGTLRELPEDAWKKAFAGIQSLQLDLPASPPNQAQWEERLSQL